MAGLSARVVLFYTAAIGLALGIFTRSFWQLGLPEITFILLLSFGLELLRHKSGGVTSTFVSRGLQVTAVSLFLFTFALGALRLEVAQWYQAAPYFSNHVDTEVNIVGTIVREPDQRESTTHLYVESEGEMLLVTADRFGEFTYGDVVTVEGMLTKPEAFETDLGRTFNYPGYLEARGVSYMVRFAAVDVVDRGQGNPILATLLTFKHNFMDMVERLLPEPQVGLGEGLLLGVKRALGEDLEQVFRETGIIHIVVLSGYNVMLVVIFVTYLLGVFIPQRWQLPFGLVAIAGFALMVGLSATVVRASVMAAIYMLARSLNRTYLVIRALVLAGVVMLLLNPYLLAFDTGFQLSFVATLGLILAAPWLEARLERIPNTFIKAREFLTATLATQIFVLPILLYQIGEFSLVAVMVNVLVLPMVPVAMLLTFITGLVGFVSLEVAGFLALLTYWSLSYIITIAEFFAALPFASFVVPAFPFWVVPISYAVLGYTLWRLYHPREKSDNPGASDPHVNDNELAGWTIVEEADFLKQMAAESRLPAAPGTAQAGSDSAAIKPDTPVFFKRRDSPPPPSSNS